MERSSLFALVFGLIFVGVAGAQQYPLMDMAADNLIQKYQQSSCQQLWAQRGKPKPAKVKEAIRLLHDDPQMRAA